MDVQEIIPQRYPFQLIDRLLDVEPGKQAIAQKLITIHEWYFAGQTTANPVVPRPILIESLAQTGVAAILSLPAYQDRNVFFGGIRSAEFMSDFYPGDDLTLHVALTKMKCNMGVGTGQIVRNHETICQAELIFAIS